MLEYLFTEIEVKTVLCLSLVNLPLGRIRRRYISEFGVISNDELEAVLEQLYRKGNIRRTGTKPYKYGLAMLAIGIFEFHVDDLTPRLVDILHRYYDEGFMDEFFSISIPQLRTSPHSKAVIPEHRIDTYDNIREFVQKTKQEIHVANCVCKQSEDIIGKRCRQTDDFEICIMFGETSYSDRGRARRISNDECLAILDRAEEKGLVVQPSNTREPYCICLCCGCCCGVITSAKKFDKPAELFATNYYAVLDPGRCSGCGICIKRCQMDAITRVDKTTVKLDNERCIGCGLCVTKCSKSAINLRRKSKITRPPMNVEMLYLSILNKKAGRLKMLVSLFKLGTGMRL